MTNEKVHITIELPRDYRVWDLLDLPGRIVDITGIEHIDFDAYGPTRAVFPDERYKKINTYARGEIEDRKREYSERYSVPASEALSKPGEWVRHTGTECPVHPLDVVEIVTDTFRIEGPYSARSFEWHAAGARGILHYRHVTDSDGIPYVYDDGSLPEWAEYVATDSPGGASGDGVWIYSAKPDMKGHLGQWDSWHTEYERASDAYANTLVPWTESLRRVWREE